jgi:tetratricopeptide (TPR) repeat protein
MSLKFIFSAAAPFDQPAPVRIEREVGCLLRSANSTAKDWQMRGLFPSSIRNLQRELRNPHEARIVHISSHASSTGLQLENDFGIAEVCRAADLAEIFAVSPPDLLFLSGCNTEPIADEIHRTIRERKPWIISTTRDISDDEVNEFVEKFYSTFFSQADIEASVYFARTALSSKDAWYLHKGEADLMTVSGRVEVDRSLLDVLNWTLTLRSIIPRVDELYEIYSFLKGPSAAQWVLGAPRSGVSTLLRVAASRYSWMFDHPPILLDCTNKSFMEIQENINRVTSEHQSTTFEQAIQTNSTLICFDNFDRADVRLKRELISQIRKLQGNCSSRLLLGSLLSNELPDISTPPLIIGELTDKETNDYLQRELDNATVNQLRDVIPRKNRLPGRLVDFVNDVRNGASAAELRSRQEEGDPRAGLERQLERALSDEASVRLLQVLSIVGSPLPRSVALETFAVGVYPNLVTDDDSTNHFEEAVRKLRHMQYLRVENIQRSSKSVPESYFVCPPDLVRLIRDRFSGLPPSHLRTMANRALEIAIARAKSGVITPDHDMQWIRRLTHSALEADHDKSAVELGSILFQVQGTFRYARDTDGEALVSLMLRAARSAMDWDAAGYFSLLLGEIRYSSGRLDEAEEVFRAYLTTACPNFRRLQLLRALGQISYRKGDYSQAVELYEEALRFSGEADREFMASVEHHQSKAFFRLGRLDLALQGFARVVAIREAADNMRGTLKARHEEARVMQTLGRIDEAETAYKLVIAGAIAIGFEALLPAPFYQLALLELSQNRPEAAAVYAAKCRQLADRHADPFWSAHSFLASAMINYDLGNSEAATTDLLACLEIAKERGYVQIAEDSKAWLTRKLASVNADSAELKQLVMAQYPGLDHSKAEKALRYSSEPERIQFFKVVLHSSSAERQISWEKNRGWHCSCDYWASNKVCSHVVALHLLLPRMTQNLPQHSETSEV